ncbi:MAG: hypothetical protein HY904_15340 [Deltaproteobacteria bacterium]|nr:hypothetical protein [Deltaproteobacteria bacterium]
MSITMSPVRAQFAQNVASATNNSFITLDTVASLRKELASLTRPDREVMANWVQNTRPFLADVMKQGWASRFFTCDPEISTVLGNGRVVQDALPLRAGDISEEGWRAYRKVDFEMPNKGNQ